MSFQFSFRTDIGTLAARQLSVSRIVSYSHDSAATFGVRRRSPSRHDVCGESSRLTHYPLVPPLLVAVERFIRSVIFDGRRARAFQPNTNDAYRCSCRAYLSSFPVGETSDNQPYEPVQALADISRSALYAFAVYKAIRLHTCVVIATKPVHRLQIRPKVHS